MSTTPSSASTASKKPAAPKTPAKKTPAKKAPAKAAAATPMKKETALAPAKKTAAPVPAKKTPAKAPAKKAVPAKKTASARSGGREAMLARVESVRQAQRGEGHFDCFGRAGDGYCDQGECAYHAECLSVSRLMHSL